jgi:hypothetical protein
MSIVNVHPSEKEVLGLDGFTFVVGSKVAQPHQPHGKLRRFWWHLSAIKYSLMPLQSRMGQPGMMGHARGVAAKH